MATRRWALSGLRARAYDAFTSTRWGRLVPPIAGIMLWAALSTPVTAQSPAPGGFMESATTTQGRPRMTPPLPDRGPFIFPAPYNTQGVRLTNGDDCGGADCVDYIGYSYWRNMNNHAGRDTMLIFVTLDRARGGGGPTLFSYNKLTDQVTKVGPLFGSSSAFSWATGEGWYWSPTQASTLYIPGGAVLYRYDVNTKQLDTVFDANPHFGGNRVIWQTHTSDDDTVHSATLRDGSTWEMLGCRCIARAPSSSRTFRKRATSTSVRWTRAVSGC